MLLLLNEGFLAVNEQRKPYYELRDSKGGEEPGHFIPELCRVKVFLALSSIVLALPPLMKPNKAEAAVNGYNTVRVLRSVLLTGWLQRYFTWNHEL